MGTIQKIAPIRCELYASTEHPGWETSLAEVEAWSLQLCEETLFMAGLGRFARHCEVSLVLADDATVKKLNGQYRGKKKPTNVLSFPIYPLSPGHWETLSRQPTPVALGDIIFAYETVAKEAEEQGKALKAHYAHLFVHGLLHLLGYDHENDTQAEMMESLEISILARFGIGNPYEEVENV